MTALPEAPEAGPDCHAVADDFARRLPELDLGFLRMMRQFMQVRLGTTAEQPCDVERVQVLAHEIDRRLARLHLQAELRQFDEPSAPFSS